MYPEVSVSHEVVNSETDLIFKEGKMYFNIEINYGRSGVLRRKNMSYTFQLALRDIKKAKEYKKENQVIQININSFDPYGYGDLVYESGMMVKKYNIEYSEVIKIYEINLEYYKKIAYNYIER